MNLILLFSNQLLSVFRLPQSFFKWMAACQMALFHPLHLLSLEASSLNSFLTKRDLEFTRSILAKPARRIQDASASRLPCVSVAASPSAIILPLCCSLTTSLLLSTLISYSAGKWGKEAFQAFPTLPARSSPSYCTCAQGMSGKVSSCPHRQLET